MFGRLATMLEFAARAALADLALERPESNLALVIRRAVGASIRGSLSITTPVEEATTVMFTGAADGSAIVSSTVAPGEAK